MIDRSVRWRRWPFAGMLLTGGLVFQAGGATCADLSAEFVAGLSTSIASELIRTFVFDFFDLGTGFGGGFF